MSVAEEDRRGDDEQGAGGGVDLPLSSKVNFTMINNTPIELQILVYTPLIQGFPLCYDIEFLKCCLI